jgi:hypothetical protein
LGDTPKPAAKLAPREQPSVVELTVAVTPRGARLFLDNKPLEGNPATARVPVDTATHELRAEASGYTTRTRSIILDKDQAIVLTLEKDKPKPAAGRAAAPNRSSEDLSIEAKPAPKKIHSIDEKNPYGGP